MRVLTDDVKRGRPVHEGVDPQSWIGFEERIGRKRFAALTEMIQTAVAAGDFPLAQANLEEARAICPDAPELLDLELQVLAITPDRFDYWARIGSAIVLLVAGVALMIGAESLRRLQQAAELPQVTPANLASVTAAFGLLPAREEVPIDVMVPMAAAPVEPEPAAPRLERVARVPTPLSETASRRPPEPVRPLPRSAESAAPADIDNGDKQDTDIVDKEDNEILTPLEARDSTWSNMEPPRAAAPPRVMTSAPAPSASPAPPTAAPPPVPTDETRVADVLQQYVRAYEQLNARAAREVWPTVDERALARAFDGLVSQRFSFDDCQIDVRGVTANATCRGEARYVGKVGSGELRAEPRAWRFELRRDGEAWKIATAEARRPTS